MQLWYSERCFERVLQEWGGLRDEEKFTPELMEYFVSNMCSGPSIFCNKTVKLYLFKKVLFQNGKMMACLVKTRHDQASPLESEHPITILEGIENGRAMVTMTRSFLEGIDYKNVPYYNEVSSYAEEYFIPRENIAAKIEVKHNGRCGHICVGHGVGEAWTAVLHELVLAGVYPPEAEQYSSGNYLPSQFWLHSDGSK